MRDDVEHSPIRTAMVFLKAPRLGYVKTRLARGLGETRALEIYRELAESQLRRIPATWRVEIHFTPTDAEQEMGAWLGPAAYFAQEPGDLGSRLASAFVGAFARGAGEVYAVGADCPELDEILFRRARAILQKHDVALGPAIDGGYYLIGLRAPASGLFDGIAWSTSAVLEQTLARAKVLGLSAALLPAKRDIDDAESWEEHCTAAKVRERESAGT